MQTAEKLSSAVLTVIAAKCLNLIGSAKKIKEKHPKIKLIALSSIGELSKEESINFYDKLTKPIKKSYNY